MALPFPVPSQLEIADIVFGVVQAIRILFRHSLNIADAEVLYAVGIK